LRAVRRGVIVVLALAASCGHSTAPAGVSGAVHARLDARTAALVGSVAIPVSLVADVARAQHSTPRIALDRLIADALAAEGARASGEDRAPLIAWGLEVGVARATAEHVSAASRAAGPPTDAEVRELTRYHWREVDLPEQIKVIHAVVRRPKDPSQNEAARVLAGDLARVLAGAKSVEDFETRAKAFPRGSFEITVEDLPAFVSDGRTAEGEPQLLDASFARGSVALKKPGDTSGIVESPFGWHVIRLVERLPPKIVPFAERRARFVDEVYVLRSHDALDAILSARRSAMPVDIQSDAEALMATVQPSAMP
jgi:PPIC-type PPIASE domain